MSKVTILVVDDERVNFTKTPLPKTVLPYEFCLDYRGPIQSDDAPDYSRGPFTKHAEFLREMSGNAIVLLDLGLSQTTLTEGERLEAEDWFSSVIDSYVNDNHMVGGLYILKKVLENQNWSGELCVVSTYMSERIQIPIEESLQLQGFSSEGEAIRRGNVYVRFLRSLSNPDQTNVVIQTAITHFLGDFEPIWWFLQPPKLSRTSNQFENVWFPEYAHNPKDGSDFDTHFDAVRSRFPKWKLSDWAKVLVSTGKETPYELMRNAVTDGMKGSNFVAVECLLDFFGDKLKLQNLDANDQIQLPTIPAFPFLIAVQKLLNSVASEKTRIVLRKMANNVMVLGVQNKEGIAVSDKELSDRWDLLSRLWAGETAEAESGSEKSADKDVRFGTVLDALRHALSAKSKLPEVTDLPLPQLAGLLNGIPHVATPWITETFVGLSWKSQYKPSRRSLEIGKGT
jgi:hypothetical protein